MRLKLCLRCNRHFAPDQFKAGSCLDCARKYQHDRDQRRGTASQRGYGAAWRKLRDELIAEHPYCAECGTTEKLTVDHIIPKRDGGTDDRSNLRVLCETHNKGRSRASIEPRPRFSRNTLTGTDNDPSVA